MQLGSKFSPSISRQVIFSVPRFSVCVSATFASASVPGHAVLPAVGARNRRVQGLVTFKCCAHIWWPSGSASFYNLSCSSWAQGRQPRHNLNSLISLITCNMMTYFYESCRYLSLSMHLQSVAHMRSASAAVAAVTAAASLAAEAGVEILQGGGSILHEQVGMGCPLWACWCGCLAQCIGRQQRRAILVKTGTKTERGWRCCRGVAASSTKWARPGCDTTGKGKA